MKVLFVQETDWLKRNPLQQHHLAEMLSLRGHEIRAIDFELLWASQGKKELFTRRQVFQRVAKIYNGAGVTVIRPGIIKISPLDYISLLFTHRSELRRQLSEFKPDVVVGFGILNAYLAAQAVKGTTIPFIYHWLDILHWLIPFRPFRALGRTIESRTLRRTDKVIAVSDKMKDFLIGMGAAPGRVAVVKPGISLKQFQPSISGAEMRSRYGLKNGDIVMFFMGWLYAFSGLKEVALELARNSHSQLKLMIVGEGDVYDDLKRIQQEHNLEERLILTGRRPYTEMPALIAAADICLLPAYPREKIMQDGLPAKIYEYLAMGKPMISTKLAATMREFGDGNGVLYVDEPADVVQKSLELVKSGKLDECGRQARKFAEKYDWANIADQFERVLQDAIKEKANARRA